MVFSLLKCSRLVRFILLVIVFSLSHSISKQPSMLSLWVELNSKFFKLVTFSPQVLYFLACQLARFVLASANLNKVIFYLEINQVFLFDQEAHAC